MPLLEAAGHTALAPDLLGMGTEPTLLSTVTLAAWAEQIATHIKEQSEPAILVGHNRGGIVISEVAERVPDRITSLAYLAAFLVPSGQTLMTVSAKVQRKRQSDIVMGADGTSTMRPEAAGPVFYNTTEREWTERAKMSVSPEPMAVMMTPLQLTPKRYGSVPRAYIECTEDNAIPLELQRMMQNELPCDPVLTLGTDHSPFYSAPEKLVASLIKSCNKIDR